MSQRSLKIRWPFLLALAFVLGFAAKGLWLSAPVAAENDVISVREIQLTDAEGKARARISIGEDGVPKIEVLDMNGQVTKLEPILKGPEVYVPDQNPTGQSQPDYMRPQEAPADPKCLVLQPKVGFARIP